MASRAFLLKLGVAACLIAWVAGSADADCTCRAGGRDYALGQSACLQTPSGFRLATCDMVLNNTSWRMTGAPCVGAERPPGPPEGRDRAPASAADG